MVLRVRGNPRYVASAAYSLCTLIALWLVGPSGARTLSASLQRQFAKERQRIRKEHNAIRDEQNRRFLSTGAQSSSESSRRFRGTRVAIECHTAPLFQCPTCHTQLVTEQQSVLRTIQQQYPRATLVESTHKLLNMLFVSLPDVEDDEDALHEYILSIAGVDKVTPSEEYTLLDFVPSIDSRNTTNVWNSSYASPLRDIGLDVAAQTHCATGQGIRIAVCDGGVDYTHIALGGVGTVDAFAAAYGTSIDDALNRQRDGLFPTDTVTEGYDFLGDVYRDGDTSFIATADDDPIDWAGHGTAVAHAVRAVAPDAQIWAVKICTTTGHTCPDFAFVRGMEYVLDPNQDGDTSDAVDIVNLSLGRLYASNYYSVLARAVEESLNYGVLPVLAAGNNGNFPFVLGGAPATPNALTVGATLVHDDDPTSVRTMAHYSSRGPGESNLIKPDLVAPGGPYGLAKATTGNLYTAVEGTSFAAPLVAGAAALVRQACPDCSPLAVKAILMNHATHVVQSTTDHGTVAPVTWQGSGALQIQKSLAATFWAYCTDHVNPSISLGLINASHNMTLQRTIRIVKLTDEMEPVSLGYEFRGNSSGVTIRFLPVETVVLDGLCGTEYFFTVEFQIDASRAPSNHMSSSGSAGNDPNTLDTNEVDGWILLTSNATDQQVSIPFHMILRKAADVTLQTATFDAQTLTNLPVNLTVGLRNAGAGTAQVDIFQLLYTGDDAPESEYGINNPPADLRYVGYRVVPLRAPGCQDLVEIAIVTWERQSTIAYTHFNAWIDVDFDGTSEHTVFNSGYRLGSAQNEMRRISLLDGTEYCVKYPPDHATNTASTVIRFCTDDVGVEQRRGVISLAVTSYSFPEITAVDVMDYRNISIPVAGLSAPSYDLVSESVLDHILVSGEIDTAHVVEPMGLLIMTNSYRSPTSTGSSTGVSEALVVTRQGTVVPQETTPDVLVYPVPKDVTGPTCAWQTALGSCFGRQLDDLVSRYATTSIVKTNESVRHDLLDRRALQATTQCPEFPLPRLNVTTIERSPTFSQWVPPTPSPVNSDTAATTSVDDSDGGVGLNRLDHVVLVLLGAVVVLFT